MYKNDSPSMTVYMACACSTCTYTCAYTCTMYIMIIMCTCTCTYRYTCTYYMYMYIYMHIYMYMYNVYSNPIYSPDSEPDIAASNVDTLNSLRASSMWLSKAKGEIDIFASDSAIRIMASSCLWDDKII